MCCSFGIGGPFELFEGSVEQGLVLLQDALEDTARVTGTFSLSGEGIPSSNGERVNTSPFSDVLVQFALSATICLLCVA